MKEKIIEKAYAKINLHLDVTGVLPDGYHAVSTVMQTVSLCDTVAISDIKITDGEPRFTISCSRPDVPCDHRNIALRAARLFCDAAGVALSANIHIEKNIPMAAGLAGGSTDGAAVLRGLNRAMGQPLTVEELCALGARLGADVPFCIVGGTKFADGRGDILHELSPMPDCTLVICCEGEGVSTPWGYHLLDTAFDGFSAGAYAPRDVSPLKNALAHGSVNETAKRIYNIFEAPVLALRPVAARVKDTLISAGADGAVMSGSGPSVFGIFASDKHARSAAASLTNMGYHPYICRPVSYVTEESDA